MRSVQKIEDISLTPKFEKQKREKLNCLYGSSYSVYEKLEQDDFLSPFLFKRGKQMRKKSLSEPISYIENLEDVFPSIDVFSQPIEKASKKFPKSPRGDKKKKIEHLARQ
ncbi:MAG: hypothetical protein Q8K37_07700 [Alphaproteobacteria bacterium]|nr:hypothetical protein [Alphaproteobacteria bacterium]